MKIVETLLNENQRVKTVSNRRLAIVLHHTAGWENPLSVVKMWNNDSIGRIGTHYVIGGQKVTDNSAIHDGLVVRCIPDLGWNAWHLGGGPIGQNHASIGIEICSAGILKALPSGQKRTWFGQNANELQICKLDKPFRGSSYYHRYSEAQLLALKELLIEQANMHNIDLTEGLIGDIRKGMKFADALNKPVQNEDGLVKGLYSHTNFRRDKSDVFPQPELLDMLMSI